MLTRSLLIGIACVIVPLHAGQVATWLFDEQVESYPSTNLSDAGSHAYVLALGRGAKLVPGKFGNALLAIEPEPLKISGSDVRPNSESARRFGLVPIPIPPGRRVQPLWWGNATFAALATAGEKHLRSAGFQNPTTTRLNLGHFDWTVEFWFQAASQGTDGVVFEVGEGPRLENDHVTRLLLTRARTEFELFNQPSSTRLRIPTDATALRDSKGWHHLAFVYTANADQLRHYVDGKLQTLPRKAAVEPLPHGTEGYISIARDGSFSRPLPGKIDELRFSDEALYGTDFTPPSTFAERIPQISLKAGPPLLFGSGKTKSVVDLGDRKHLFIDGAFVEHSTGISFVPNPPIRIDKIADEIRGHLTTVQDETGLIRIYYRGPNDSLAVMTSRDGVHWDKPDAGHGAYEGARNIVLPENVGLGAVIIDPNNPPEARYVYVSGVEFRAVYLYTSRDGFWFTKHPTAVLPFSAGSQSALYYDDQRQLYVAHHRSDYGMTPGGSTSRRFVVSEVKDLFKPWPFTHVTEEQTNVVAKIQRIQYAKLDPWFLDNGPLAPGGFGIDLPTIFTADEKVDPPGTDIYVTKAVKYPWAPDTYLAFPAVYFHYQSDGPKPRRTLGEPDRERGSGVVETQLAVSRDGLSWQRYPRPAYVPVGGDGSNTVHMLFVTHGLIRRGDEIWQFVGGHGGSGTGYHSPYVKDRPAPLFRYVQRLDGFVAAEADYRGGEFVTRPFTFSGNQLQLNINTNAVGFAQVGFVDQHGNPVPGFSVDDCVYINGDFIRTPVEWLHRGTDVSSLAGKTVRLVFRMRGTRLFAMQFQEVR